MLYARKFCFNALSNLKSLVRIYFLLFRRVAVGRCRAGASPEPRSKIQDDMDYELFYNSLSLDTEASSSSSFMNFVFLFILVTVLVLNFWLSDTIS